MPIDPYANCHFDIDSDFCTLDTCCLAQSSFNYIPNHGGNIFFACFFGIAILPHLFLGIKFKTWGYMAGMICGLILELVGYYARVWLHNSPFSNDAFLMYLICLTIAPVFITAAIYLCLSRIIVIYGSHLSFFKSRTLSLLFMTSDFISLVLQALGGALAETSNDDAGSTTGKNIMVAGLLLQAISLVFFSAVWASFMFRVRGGVLDQAADKVLVRRSALFKIFQASLLLATTAIIVRSIYRVAELWGGFHGKLWNDEVDFMLLDGAMMAFAVLLLTAFHPGMAFAGMWNTANWTFRSKDSSSRATVVHGDVTELKSQSDSSNTPLQRSRRIRQFWRR